MKQVSLKKAIRKSIIFALVFLQCGYIFLSSPKVASTSPLTSAYATMGNSRLSYKAQLSGTYSSGVSTFNIEASGWPDVTTAHLFPKDTVCFVNSAETGCVGNTSYTVGSIVDGDTFTTTTATGGSLADTDMPVASQSGSLVVSFTTTTTIPSNGNILLTIPAIDHATKPCDGIPDHAATTATNGFDLGPTGNRVSASDITVTGCTDSDWVATETITCGDGSNDHRIAISRQNTTCTAGSAITITIDSSPGIINPAPITTGHTQGNADTYQLNVKTRDNANNTLDQADIPIAPVEAVLVSTTVDETLSFTVGSVSSSTTACNVSTDVSTTATSVPFGTLGAANTFYDAAQDLQVSTNADSGYSVTATHTDQLGRDGNSCVGDVGEAASCIKDTTCNGGSCGHTIASADDWTTATNNGFGFSLDSTDGSDAKVEWDNTGTSPTTDCASGTFCALQFADQEAGESATAIMSNTGPVSSKNMYVCYRISISSTQPAGYYQTIVRYTATATF